MVLNAYKLVLLACCLTLGSSLNCTYTIQPNDILFDIATKFKTSVQKIQDANRGLDPNTLAVGQIINLPSDAPVCAAVAAQTGAGCTCLPSWTWSGTTFTGCASPDSASQPWCIVPDSCTNVQGTRPETTPPGQKWKTCACTYTIQSGDTLFKLSQRYDVTIDGVTRANPGLNPDSIPLGEAINMPQDSRYCAVIYKQGGSCTYTTAQGDSLPLVAVRLNVSAADLQLYNPGLARTGVLQPGQLVFMPTDSFYCTDTRFWKSSCMYQIQSGDTWSGIALRYGTTETELQNLNQDIDPNNLQIGQRIVMPLDGSYCRALRGEAAIPTVPTTPGPVSTPSTPTRATTPSTPTPADTPSTTNPTPDTAPSTTNPTPDTTPSATTPTPAATPSTTPAATPTPSTPEGPTSRGVRGTTPAGTTSGTADGGTVTGSSGDSKKKAPIGAIVGAVVGGVAAVLLAAFIILLVLKKKRRDRQQSAVFKPFPAPTVTTGNDAGGNYYVAGQAAGTGTTGYTEYTGYKQGVAATRDATVYEVYAEAEDVKSSTQTGYSSLGVTTTLGATTNTAVGSSVTYTGPNPVGLKSGESVMINAQYYSWTTCPFPAYNLEADVNDVELGAAPNSTAGHTPALTLTPEAVKDEIEILEDGLLGKGATAMVFKCRWPRRFGPNRLLAIKLLRNCLDDDCRVVDSFRYEASLLTSVRHKNVVRMYGCCLEAPTICIIMELLPRSLKDKLSVVPSASPLVTTSPFELRSPPGSSPLTMLDVLQLSADVAAGLAFLHSKDEPLIADCQVADGSSIRPRIAHRDLKPANILLNMAGRAKISDFGLARLHDNTSLHTEFAGVGTIPYMAPELLESQHLDPRQRTGPVAITNKVDIYAFAMLVYECIRGQVWGGGISAPQIVSRVVSLAQRPELPDAATLSAAPPPGKLDLATTPARFELLPDLVHLITDCWAQEPQARPTAAEVYRRIGLMLQSYGFRAPGQMDVSLSITSPGNRA